MATTEARKLASHHPTYDDAPSEARTDTRLDDRGVVEHAPSRIRGAPDLLRRPWHSAARERLYPLRAGPEAVAVNSSTGECQNSITE